MAIRDFQFIVGPETSTLPTTGTPSLPTDLVTLSYAQQNFVQGGSGVASITALKALTDHDDKDLRFVENEDNLFNYDSASTATPDDDLVAKPDDVLLANPGRWLRFTETQKGSIYKATSFASKTVVSGEVLFSPFLIVPVGQTYTIDSGAYFASIGAVINNGTFINNGTMNIA